MPIKATPEKKNFNNRKDSTSPKSFSKDRDSKSFSKDNGPKSFSKDKSPKTFSKAGGQKTFSKDKTKYNDKNNASESTDKSKKIDPRKERLLKKPNAKLVSIFQYLKRFISW